MFIEPNTPHINLVFQRPGCEAPCALRSRAAEKQINRSMLTFYKHVTPNGVKASASSGGPSPSMFRWVLKGSLCGLLSRPAQARQPQSQRQQNERGGFGDDREIPRVVVLEI